MHYRVLYEIEGKTYACEYASRAEAQRNSDDIDGYGFVTRTEVRHSGEIQQGPVVIEPAPTCWERLSVTD